jgi:hypothetical protein
MLVITSVSAGCDELEDDMSRCEDLGYELCELLDDVRCNDDAGIAERCLQNEEIGGCFQWMPEEVCGEHQVCQRAEGGVRCTCRHECELIDVTRCEETMILQCQIDDQECFYWESAQDCASEGAGCDDSSGEALCDLQCDQCEVDGQTRCDDDTILVCAGDDLGCLVWTSSHDCTADGRVCDESSGEAECGCPPECEFNSTRCSEDLTQVEVCTERGDACLYWVTHADCTAEGLFCEDRDIGPHCACPVICSDGAGRCEGDLLQTCGALISGCGEWNDRADCASFGLPCVEEGDRATCRTLSGNSCLAAQVIWELPIEISGDSFASDYTDSLLLAGEGCSANAGQPEAVFAIDMEPGQRVQITQTQPWPVTISVLNDCSEEAACPTSEERLGSVSPLVYEATAAGRVYVVVEANTEEPPTVSYTIAINREGP